MSQSYYLSEPILQKVGFLNTDFSHDDYYIIFDEKAMHSKKDVPERGASNICYQVLVKHKDKDEQPIPMILKEFCPSDSIFEATMSRDASGKLCYDFPPDMEADFTKRLKDKKAALENAYAIQRHLIKSDATMGIVVKPVDAWSPDELTYYTLHEANYANSLDNDPPDDLYEILRVMHMTADAVGRMDKQGFVHGDLKPANILYTDRGYSTASVRLFDFDCSCNYLKEEYPDALYGTDGYNAPELRNPSSIFGMAGIYTPSLDVYSLGAILFWLLLREHPTLEDERSASYDSAPFYEKLIYKFEYEWREQFSRKAQNDLAEILWRSLRKSCNPCIRTSRYSDPAQLAEKLGKLLNSLNMRPLPENEVSHSSYTMLSAGIISQYPLYDYMKPDSDRIDVVLAGISPMRDSFLEHLVSSCQMLDRKIHIHIIAPHVEDYLEQIRSKYPALQKTVCIRLSGEVYSMPDKSITETPLAVLDCWDKTLENLQEVSADYYLLVDTNTNANFETAKALYERRTNPKDFFIGYVDSRGDGCNLRELPFPNVQDASPIGCNEDFSKSEQVFQSVIVERAFQVHKRYADTSKDDDTLRKEFRKETAYYNQSSSIRAALSLSYAIGIHLRQAGSVESFEEELNKHGDVYNKLLWLEHRAWTGFMVMQGYQLPTFEQVKAYAFQHGNDQRDKKNKLHPCMCPSRAEGLQLSDQKNPDWENNANDAKYDPLDLFSLSFHRFCREKINKERIHAILSVMPVCADNNAEKAFADDVQTACKAILNGSNDAWNELKMPEPITETFSRLFHTLEAEVAFVKEYNKFHDFKASDEDILNAVSDIFRK